MGAGVEDFSDGLHGARSFGALVRGALMALRFGGFWQLRWY